MSSVNQFMREAASRVLKEALQAYARSTGKRFSCNMLSGNSNYNLAINCDMTVSCNCQDYDGSGQLGDLSQADLAEVFNGPTASRFRRDLSRGRLPINTCARCSELRLIDRSQAEKHLGRKDVPQNGIMVENTILCNLRCLGCPRDRVVRRRKKKNLSLEDVQRISALIRRHGIKRVSYFNLGETFLSPNIHQELKIIRSQNPELEILISTNGMQLNDPGRVSAALLADQIVFSIDGPSTEILKKYQVRGNFEVAYRNMLDLVEQRNWQGLNRPLIEWKYVLFNWNDRKPHVTRAIDLARRAGVDVISFWPTLNPFYGISIRYRLGDFVSRVGQPSWKGREVVLTDRPETD